MRAFAGYNDPTVPFLDEASSHLDAESERLVRQAIKALRLTRVLIAPRKETVATAGRILVLNSGGKIVRREEVHGLRAL